MDCIPPSRPCLNRGEYVDDKTRVHCYRTAVCNEVRGVHQGWYTSKVNVLFNVDVFKERASRLDRPHSLASNVQRLIFLL
jgi:hypothetical protein